ANLRGANLSEANLSEANLRGANLIKANLEQVTASRANFQKADLRGIPWLIVMDLTLQPGVNVADMRWDGPPKEQGRAFPTL
ncbi:MAG: pentapeptide repeat-containing protein, partial [Ktedonobacteraceae bacterium]|nr:pentapeptide repeat-containing protein [Ktedonobacteraceae bacterium]